MKKLTCCLCSNNEDEPIYSGKIRDGQYGSLSKAEVDVLQCTHCGLVRLSHDMNEPDFYESETYRETFNGTASIESYVHVHDVEQPPRINKIGIEAFRNKVVLDIGCGGGAFLDQVAGVAKTTIAVEPFVGFHEELKKKGHIVVSSSEELLPEWRTSIDTIVSFGVIEHVDNPLSFLKDAYPLLKDDGCFYLETDNLNDILMKLNVEAFPTFFYRTAHLWYFNAETLSTLARKAGYHISNTSFRHNFDLSNTLVWANNGIPSGNGKLSFIDNNLNLMWKQFLEQQGYADLIFMQLTKGRN
ncbi:class I SAM-dependent methyltransferase [Aestuariibacter sp. AA17]|uniref:Class I SAM-dependent methyltransferase n=1 Tax=Fluctibacter corallii TaxID=2984329 RepID=A0ABT3A9S6_9ALTE|nr:class I SAM-dependent methyltransferase [Aestuariibacter sp. AA17]MCV2885438.1 class I SAM-dependent methyltransferase [Aestuariibacter sp. AA17]